ncbi:MAG: PAS domain S-box protein [Methanoregula sp.]|nr:PAS domain S-box protein [Methanoregula sp.]
MISVLYVDDEEDLLQLAKFYLEQTSQFAISISSSAQDALQSSHLLSYDAIISDYQMPMMDGIAFLKAFRQQSTDIPFLLFTGRGREEIVIEAINNGADFYIQKGGDPMAQFAELAHKIKKSVERQRAVAALEKSENLYRTIFTTTGAATIIVAPDTTILLANEGWENLTGMPRAEQENILSWTIFFDRADVELMTGYHHARRKDPSSAPSVYESRLIDAQKRVHNVIVHVHMIPGTKNSVASLVDITDRKLAQDELQKSEERFRSVVNDQTEMIARFTPDGLITFVNEAYHQYVAPMLNLSGITGKNFHEIMQVKNDAEVENFLHSLTREYPIREIEREVTGSDGRPRWQIWSVRALFGEGDTPAEYQVVGRDITENKLLTKNLQRKNEELNASYEQIAAHEEELRVQLDELVQRQAALNVSEQRFRELAEMLPLGIYEYDLDCRITYVNRRILEMFGYTAEDIIRGLTVTSIIAPGDRERVATVIRQRLEGSLPPLGQTDYCALRKDGSMFPVTAFSSVLYKNERVVGNRSVIMDITVQKQAADELRAANEQLAASATELRRQYEELARSGTRIRESEAQFRVIFDTSPYVIVINRRSDGTYLAMNPAWERASGYRQAEALGKTSSDLGVIVPESESLIKRTLETEGRVDRLEITAKNRSGAERYHILSATPIQFLDEPAVLSVLVDITDRKLAETAVLRHKQLMEEIATSMPGVVFQYVVRDDGSSGFSYVNERAARQVFGFDSPMQEFSAWFVSRVHAEDRERFLSAQTAAMNCCTEWDFSGRFTKPSGAKIWFKGRAIPTVHENEVVFTGILLDITKEKLTDERYQLLAEEVGNVIWTQETSSGRFTYFSPSVTKLIGYTPEEARMLPIEAIVAPGSLYTISKELPRRLAAFASGEDSVRVQTDDIDLIRKDGSVVTTETVTNLLAGQDREVRMIIGVSRDISARRRADEIHQETGERYRQYFKTPPDSVFFTTPEGKWVDCNDALVKMFGYESREDLCSVPVSALYVYPEVRSEFLARVEQEGCVRDQPLQFRKKDGTIFEGLITIIAQRNLDGSLNGLTGMIYDLSRTCDRHPAPGY